jgi:hypothetical protein
LCGLIGPVSAEFSVDIHMCGALMGNFNTSLEVLL